MPITLCVTSSARLGFERLAGGSGCATVGEHAEPDRRREEQRVRIDPRLERVTHAAAASTIAATSSSVSWTSDAWKFDHRRAAAGLTHERDALVERK